MSYSNKDLPDYHRDVGDKGFVLLSVEEINKDLTLDAGASSIVVIVSPDTHQFGELLSLVVFHTEQPNAIPNIRKRQTIGAFSLTSFKTDLTQGLTNLEYSLDLTTKRFTTYKTTSLIQRLIIEVYGKAVGGSNNINIRGIWSRYGIKE